MRIVRISRHVSHCVTALAAGTHVRNLAQEDGSAAANEIMAAAFTEGARRVGLSDPKLADALSRLTHAPLNRGHMERWRKAVEGAVVPAWALFYLARLANTTVDELVAHVTGDRGALTRRMDELEREMAAVREHLARLSSTIAPALQPIPPAPPERPLGNDEDVGPTT